MNITEGHDDIFCPSEQAKFHDKEALELWGEEILPGKLAPWQEYGPAYKYILSRVQHMEGTVLDVGTGNGFNLMPLSTVSDSCWAGFDISEQSVRLAKRRAEVWGVSTTHRFLVANGTEIPFQTESLDGVIGIGILHHLSPPALQQVLSEVRRVLKPGQEALFSEPIEDCAWFDRLQQVMKRVVHDTQQDPDRALTSAELYQAANGFSQTQVLRFGLSLRLSRWFASRRARKFFCALDNVLFRLLPSLERLAATAVLHCRK
jgi:SAM-dependent methyltransferase